ncbi:unnamed protein product [Thlaspi arvense]|uniref:WAT1-related protein n=1 Tax=Thlaspi arvense TaxID=13288 RepID=A0AAU9RFK7_THLAR|nr:unnamed protein product [Thlaspi arvense]
MKMDSKKPYMAVILIQSIYTGMFLLSKAAFDGGMNTCVFVFYRQAMAAVFLAPLAFFFDWITFSLNIYGVALMYTSANLAAATTNCLPVITFLLAVLLRAQWMGFTLPNIELRMEIVRLTSAGIAKITGMVICIGGVLTIALYRGPYLSLFLHHHLLGHRSFGQQHPVGGENSSTTWIKGCFLMLMSNTFFGLWLVLQARIMKSYPSKLLFTTLQCFLSSVQSFFIAIALERDPLEWKLGWNVRLLSVVYCGIVVTGVTYYLQAWVIEKKGPVFLATSSPLALIFTMLTSAILLGESITLGSVLGGMLLVGGLYSVLWGKNREQKIVLHDMNLNGEAVTETADQSKEELPSKDLPTIV